jgi:hypothetical protein
MARDYKKEYASYHSRPDQIKRRAARNAARRAMRGRKELTDEKDVHHKDNNPLNNDKSNLSIVTKHYNRREPRLRVEDLRKWFGKGKKGDWVRVGTDGEIKGDCAREPGEGKPKCMPRSKAHSMDKKDRASSARRKRRADPDADRPGTGNKPIMVKTDKKESVEMQEKFDVKYAKSKRGPIMVRSFDSAADAKKFLDQQKKQGMNGIISKKGVPVSMQRMKDMQKESVELEENKYPMASKWMQGVKSVKGKGFEFVRSRDGVHTIKKNGKDVGDFSLEMDSDLWVINLNGVRGQVTADSIDDIPKLISNKIKESVELEEKNVPTNPALWAKMKAQAKAKFDVYPSAYANGWAAKKYKAAGGGWKTESVKEMKSFWDIREGSCGTMNAQTKKDEKPPFEPTRKVGVKKDKFGNVVKDKNRAKHLAKMAMRGEKKEENMAVGAHDWKQGRDRQRAAKDAGERAKANKKARRDAYRKSQIDRGLRKESVEIDEKYGLHTDRDLIIQAVRIADRKGGSHSDKVREIEKLGKGLSKNKAVATALKQAK